MSRLWCSLGFWGSAATWSSEGIQQAVTLISPGGPGMALWEQSTPPQRAALGARATACPCSLKACAVPGAEGSSDCVFLSSGACVFLSQRVKFSTAERGYLRLCVFILILSL